MIHFPQGHMADRVADRILAIEKKIAGNSVQAQGQQLETALQQPIGDVAPIEGIEDSIALKALDL